MWVRHQSKVVLKRAVLLGGGGIVRGRVCMILYPHPPPTSFGLLVDCPMANCTLQCGAPGSVQGFAALLHQLCERHRAPCNQWTS